MFGEDMTDELASRNTTKMALPSCLASRATAHPYNARVTKSALAL